MKIRKFSIVPVAIAAVLAFATSASAATPNISSGGELTCGIEASGAVKCFGYNYYGQLGNATNNGGHLPNPTPTTVDLGGPAVQVAEGKTHTCAVLSGGAVKCFGFNYYGELGNATNNATGAPNPTPTTVDLGGAAVQVALGDNHTCALMSGGEVKCFGRNYLGQLGNTTNNSSDNPNPTPATVELGGTAVEIDAGESHTCARMSDGAVKCFGINGYGQLGNATNSGLGTPNPTPTVVELGGTAAGLSAGAYHTCVLMSDAAVKCFGRNRYGELGTTNNNDPNPTPTTVDLGGSAAQVSAGGEHTCVRMTDGAVKCFGINFFGQLGNATNLFSYMPTPTPTVADLGGTATSVSAGGTHTCARMSDGTAKCFGANFYGQLGNTTGNGASSANATPTALAGLDLSTPTPPPSGQNPSPSPTATDAAFANPAWKTKRSGSSIRLTAKLKLVGAGVDAIHCSGKIQLSITVKRKPAPRIAAKLYALQFVGGECVASVAQKIPARSVPKGTKLTLTLGVTDAALLRISKLSKTLKVR